MLNTDLDIKECLGLPLGNAFLIAEPTDTGYCFRLRSASGSECEVFRISHKMTHFRENLVQSNVISIHRDYGDPRYSQQLELLDPDGKPTVHMREDGRLYCEKCHCFVPNTANHEMQKEGCYAHSHICGVRSEGEIYEEETI